MFAEESSILSIMCGGDADYVGNVMSENQSETRIERIQEGALCCDDPQLSLDWKIGGDLLDEKKQGVIELSALCCKRCGANFKFIFSEVHYRVDGQAILVKIQRMKKVVM